MQAKANRNHNKSCKKQPQGYQPWRLSSLCLKQELAAAAGKSPAYPPADRHDCPQNLIFLLYHLTLLPPFPQVWGYFSAQRVTKCYPFLPAADFCIASPSLTAANISVNPFLFPRKPAAAPRLLHSAALLQKPRHVPAVRISYPRRSLPNPAPRNGQHQTRWYQRTAK